MDKSFDPHHVAHIAAVLLSASGLAEPHHIKAAVDAARNVIAEARSRAEEDEAAEAAKAAAFTEKDDGGTAKAE